MKKLNELNASGNSGINNQGIKNLKNITKLYVPNTQKIYDINHMNKLVEPDAGVSEINDLNIQNLNLHKLYAHYNKKITNLNHMNKLVELDASASGICDECIKI
jgi:hypothetical protein